jgi:hypothetical protein
MPLYMKNKKAHSLTIILGCVLAVAITCAQFFGIAGNQQEFRKLTKAEQTENSDDQSSYISLPSFSLPSPVHVQINLDSHCLFEILFEDKQACITSLDVPNFTQKFFVTLFRVIISPNAP